MNKLEEVISQAPDNISKEDIEVIFKKNNENVIDTLVDLWDLEAPNAPNAPNTANESTEKDIIDLKTDEHKWANIRDICDSYDLEMQTQLNRMRNKSQ
jgi:hypothetical protein